MQIMKTNKHIWKSMQIIKPWTSKKQINETQIIQMYDHVGNHKHQYKSKQLWKSLKSWENIKFNENH